MPTQPEHAVVVGTGSDADAAARLLTARGWQVRRGAPNPRLPDEVTLMVVDEWTAETAPHVRRAREAGVRVSVLAELILTDTPRPVVAITGTAGKTTTTRLVASIISADGGEPVITPSGRAHNAWPDHSIAEAAAHGDGWLVAELTSTHLCFMDAWRGPDVAVVTNLWPDHVELHGSYDRYVAAKRRILRREDGAVVLGADDPVARSALGPVAPHRIIEFSTTRPVTTGAWLLAGRLHLRTGTEPTVALDIPHETLAWVHPGALAAAAATALACDVGCAAIGRGIAATAPLAHRHVTVRMPGGVVVVDDGMAATPRKALAGMDRLDLGHTIVIAGGKATLDNRPVHADPTEAQALDHAIRRLGHARWVVTFGSAGAMLADRIDGATRVTDIASAITAVAGVARNGDTVLFAPMFPVDQEIRAGFLGRMRGALGGSATR